VTQSADSYRRYYGDLQEVEVALGTNTFARVNCRNGASGAFWELMKAYDFSSNIGFTPEQYAGDRFIFGHNLELVANNPSAIAGYSGKSDLRLEFYRSSQPPEILRFDVFILHDCLLQVGQTTGTQVVY
jgi:hypothetical protein